MNPVPLTLPQFWIPAAEVLLEDWYGPVFRAHGDDNPEMSVPVRGTVGVLVGRLADTKTIWNVAWAQPGRLPPIIRPRPTTDLGLDVSRPEVRDRVERVARELYGKDLSPWTPAGIVAAWRELRDLSCDPGPSPFGGRL